MAATCGSSYCPAQLDASGEEDENDNFNTDMTKIYTIAGIFLGCSFTAAVIIAIFVDPLTR